MSPASNLSPHLNVLLIGLDPATALDLERALPGHYTALTRNLPTNAMAFVALLRESRPDLLFCPARHRHLREILEKASAERLPVVVVTHYPDAHEWIDAMDAGASDYIASPFQSQQLEWILQSSLLQPSC